MSYRTTDAPSGAGRARPAVRRPRARWRHLGFREWRLVRWLLADPEQLIPWAHAADRSPADVVVARAVGRRLVARHGLESTAGTLAIRALMTLASRGLLSAQDLAVRGRPGAPPLVTRWRGVSAQRWHEVEWRLVAFTQDTTTRMLKRLVSEAGPLEFPADWLGAVLVHPSATRSVWRRTMARADVGRSIAALLGSPRLADVAMQDAILRVLHRRTIHRQSAVLSALARVATGARREMALTLLARLSPTAAAEMDPGRHQRLLRDRRAS